MDLDHRISDEATPRLLPDGGEPSAPVATAGRTTAWAAFAVGLLFAGVSLYWSLGGTRLLDTVGGSLAEQGRSGAAAGMAMVWAATVLKGVASVLPLVVIGRPDGAPRCRFWWTVGGLEAAILTGYGLILTSAGLLIQAGVIDTSATADHRALAWHAYLWDPWFLVWGVLVTVALLRRRAAAVAAPSAR